MFKVGHDTLEFPREAVCSWPSTVGLSLQFLSFKNLVKRNEAQREKHQNLVKIRLPFIIVSTDTSTAVECEMSDDRNNLFLNFSAPFEIHNQDEVLRKIEMQNTPRNELEALLPAPLLPYVPADSQT